MTQISGAGPPFLKHQHHVIFADLQAGWVSRVSFFTKNLQISPVSPGIAGDRHKANEANEAKFQLEGPQSSIRRLPRTPASLWGTPSLRRAQHVLPEEDGHESTRL